MGVRTTEQVKLSVEHADVAVMCLGLDAAIEGEQGDAGNEYASGDKLGLNLPGLQDPEYQLSEPQSFMSAKAYKTKIAEPLIRKLKALVKTALARCFEGWDNYHRLNITNGNLYRENEMLSKINSKLKSENENLHSEVKDYKLLRKVFGHKQINELLEQARNIKGRKRENPRSR